jgi:hypothetical protein
MTLTEFEAAVAVLPGYQRGQAARAALKLRQLVADGEGFTAARDRIVAMRQYNEPLTETEQFTNFAALTGP